MNDRQRKSKIEIVLTSLAVVVEGKVSVALVKEEEEQGLGGKFTVESSLAGTELVIVAPAEWVLDTSISVSVFLGLCCSSALFDWKISFKMKKSIWKGMVFIIFDLSKYSWLKVRTRKSCFSIANKTESTEAKLSLLLFGIYLFLLWLYTYIIYIYIYVLF